MELKKPSPPSSDKRWRIVDATMRRNGYLGTALIEALHTTQDSFGYLDESGLRYCAQSLRVPLSKVYGVATFYHIFSLRPPGRHACVVCTGTACYIRGAPGLLSTLQQLTGIKPGETTEDGGISVLSARCLGSCGLAPAVVLDGEVHGKITPPELQEKIESWLNDDA